MTTPTVRNIRNSLKSFIPNWLADVPGLNVGFAVLFVVALVLDMFIETMFEGGQAPFPGFGTNTALPYIGQSRALPRGLTETDDEYIVRLLAWLETWDNAGSAETLVQLIQTFLGNNLVIRLIDRNGNFVTANADGTTTFTTDATWDWDSAISARSSWWGDTWIVVYVTDGRYPAYTSRSDAAFLAAWGTTQGFGYGHQIPRNVIDGIFAITGAFKAAHTWIPALIWTDDTSLFNPGALGGIPDGHYGNFSKTNGSNQQVPARITAHTGHYIRYWLPPAGG